MGTANSKTSANTENADAQSADVSDGPEELDIPPKLQSPQNAQNSYEQVQVQYKPSPQEQKASMQPPPRAPAPELDVSAPETVQQSNHVSTKEKQTVSEKIAASPAYKSAEKPKEKPKQSKYDAVAYDPTFSYFETLAGQESAPKPKMVSSAYEDDLDGFDMEKFRNANNGAKEVKEDMIFAKW